MAALAISPPVVVCEDGVTRCRWASTATEYRSYHDDEWGFPVADDVRLFEMLSLEGFQAGLSWLTILRKRDAFRRAFADFDFGRVARFSPRDVERLLADPGIVRHRGKIEAVIGNAQRAVDMVRGESSLAGYLWSFEGRSPRGAAQRAAPEPLPATAEAKALAKDLRARGWRFVGATTVYAFMQAVGMVNDHAVGCDARAKAERARAQFVRP